MVGKWHIPQRRWARQLRGGLTRTSLKKSGIEMGSYCALRFSTTREAFEKFCLNTNKLKLNIAKMGFHNLFMP